VIETNLATSLIVLLPSYFRSNMNNKTFFWNVLSKG